MEFHGIPYIIIFFLKILELYGSLSSFYFLQEILEIYGIHGIPYILFGKSWKFIELHGKS